MRRFDYWIRVGNLACAIAVVVLLCIILASCQVHQCDVQTQRCSHQGQQG
jgi:hypothetical protein